MTSKTHHVHMQNAVSIRCANFFQTLHTYCELEGGNESVYPHAYSYKEQERFNFRQFHVFGSRVFVRCKHNTYTVLSQIEYRVSIRGGDMCGVNKRYREHKSQSVDSGA